MASSRRGYSKSIAKRNSDKRTQQKVHSLRLKQGTPQQPKAVRVHSAKTPSFNKRRTSGTATTTMLTIASSLEPTTPVAVTAPDNAEQLQIDFVTLREHDDNANERTSTESASDSTEVSNDDAAEDIATTDTSVESSPVQSEFTKEIVPGPRLLTQEPLHIPETILIAQAFSTPADTGSKLLSGDSTSTIAGSSHEYSTDTAEIDAHDFDSKHTADVTAASTQDLDRQQTLATTEDFVAIYELDGEYMIVHLPDLVHPHGADLTDDTNLSVNHTAGPISCKIMKNLARKGWKPVEGENIIPDSYLASPYWETSGNTIQQPYRRIGGLKSSAVTSASTQELESKSLLARLSAPCNKDLEIPQFNNDQVIMKVEQVPSDGVESTHDLSIVDEHTDVMNIAPNFLASAHEIVVDSHSGPSINSNTQVTESESGTSSDYVDAIGTKSDDGITTDSGNAATTTELGSAIAQEIECAHTAGTATANDGGVQEVTVSVGLAHVYKHIIYQHQQTHPQSSGPSTSAPPAVEAQEATSDTDLASDTVPTDDGTPQTYMIPQPLEIAPPADITPLSSAIESASVMELAEHASSSTIVGGNETEFSVAYTSAPPADDTSQSDHCEVTAALVESEATNPPIDICTSQNEHKQIAESSSDSQSLAPSTTQSETIGCTEPQLVFEGEDMAHPSTTSALSSNDHQTIVDSPPSTSSRPIVNYHDELLGILRSIRARAARRYVEITEVSGSYDDDEIDQVLTYQERIQQECKQVQGQIVHRVGLSTYSYDLRINGRTVGKVDLDVAALESLVEF